MRRNACGPTYSRYPSGHRRRHESLSVQTLLGVYLHISFTPPLLPSYAVALLLVAHGGVVQCAIEELTEQEQQLYLPMQVHGAIRQTFAQDEGAYVLLGGDDGPDKVAVGHTLLGACRAQLGVTSFHLGLGLVQQPVTQVAEYLAGAGLEFICRDFAQIAALRRVPTLLAELAGKLVDVCLDKSHQSEGQHGASPGRKSVCKGDAGTS